MKLDNPPWLTAAAPVFALLEDAGFQALAVGGCVRNTLLGVPVADVDFATDARPETVLELAQKQGYRAIPTGIDHGTITVVHKSEPYEITTFRKDVETDGRRAVVKFSTEIKDDALRRDFTMNALYARADGTLQDPLNGLPDLHARRLRFIENAFERIAEDHLRILRYFRFYAYYCDPAEGPDMEAIAAIAASIDGLETLSGERVGHEMRKLLSAPNPAPALGLMAQTHALSRILPGADARFIAPLVEIETGQPLRWQRRLVALGTGEAASLWRLSKSDKKSLGNIHIAMEMPSLIEAGYRLGEAAAIDAMLVQCASLGLEPEPQVIRTIQDAAREVFPLKAPYLMDRIPAGKALGTELKRLEKLWVESGFTLSQAALDKMVKP